MAQTINSITNNGIFKVSEAEFVSITDNTFKAELSNCKEPITVIIDVPSAVSDGYIVCESTEDGVSGKKLSLVSGKINVFRMETKGFKNIDGFVEFSSSGLANSGAKIAFLKYSAVINH